MVKKEKCPMCGKILKQDGKNQNKYVCKCGAQVVIQEKNGE